MNFKLSADATVSWTSFTPAHDRVLKEAQSVVSGQHQEAAVAAIIGVYGSGKSTLLLALARAAMESAIVIWDEARPFFERILEGQRTSPSELARRVREWADEVRTNPDAFSQHWTDLRDRGRADVAELLSSQTQGAKLAVVLLLDELEQAHSRMRELIDAGDGQYLRALMDACGSRFRLVLAYAPESYHALGAADKGRVVKLRLPTLTASVIQQRFELSRGHANFAWWASRGYARGVQKVVQEVLRPWAARELAGSIDGLAQALRDLPGVYGVPALLIDRLTPTQIEGLLDLCPQSSPSEGAVEQGIVVDLRDQRVLGDAMTNVVAGVVPDIPELGIPLAAELIAVLEAVADDDNRAYLTHGDLKAAVQLASLRAQEQENEALTDLSVEQVDQIASALFYGGKLSHTPLSKRAPHPIEWLKDEVFPAPFTDPLLPMGDGKRPTPDAVTRRYNEVRPRQKPVLRVGDVHIFHDEEELEQYIIASAGKGQPSAVRRILLLHGQQVERPLQQLLENLGRLVVRPINQFQRRFIESAVARAAPATGGADAATLDDVVRTLAADKQLGRKVRWHSDRVKSLAEDTVLGDPSRGAALDRALDTMFAPGRGGRLQPDSTGVLALLYPFREASPATRATLAKLASLLSDDCGIRRLIKVAHDQRTAKFEGAAVVVDEFLPRVESGDDRKWLLQPFDGRDTLREILDRFVAVVDPDTLARVLYPREPARLAQLARYARGVVPQLAEERQQLQGLASVEHSVSQVEKILHGVGLLVGASTPPALLGKTGAALMEARPDIEQLRRLGDEAAKIAEAWARTLALWLCGVFAERIVKGLEKDQAGLEPWLAVAQSASVLAEKLAKEEDELRAAGLDGAAERLREERARLAVSPGDDANDFRRGLDALSSMAGGLTRAREVIRKILESLQQRVAVTHLVQAYKPVPSELDGDVGRMQAILGILKELEGDPPVPACSEWTGYLEELEIHGRKTHRLQRRALLSERLGVALAQDFDSQKEDIEEASDGWPALDELTRGSMRDEWRLQQPRRGEDVARQIRAAVEKSRRLATLKPDTRVAELDNRVAVWARGIKVRSVDLEGAMEARSEAISHYDNLLRLLPETAANHELASVVRNQHGEALWSTVARLLNSTLQRVKDVRGRFSVVRGADAVPVIREAATAADAFAEVEREIALATEVQVQLRSQLDALNAQRGRIGLPKQTELDEAVPALERQLGQVTGETRKHVDEQLAAVSAELVQLGAPVHSPDTGSVELEVAVSTFENLQGFLNLVTERRGQLTSLEADVPNLADHSQKEVIALLDQAVSASKEERGALESECRLWQRRLGKLTGGPAPIAASLGTASIRKLRAEIEAAKRAVGEAREKKLATVSDAARSLYRSLLDNRSDDAFAELRVAGLVSVLEDG